MRVKWLKSSGLAALLLAACATGLCGCSGKGTGDTVPSPPRDLVDKSFHPPTGGGQPDTNAPKADGSTK